MTYSELKDRYLHNVVEVSPPFTQAAKDRLDVNINRLLDLYTKCVTNGDKTAARQQLRLHQRENIVWERDTVWRQMIGQQRRGEADTQDVSGATLVQEPEPTVVDFPTPVGRFKITKRSIFKVVAVVVFVLLLNVQVVEGREANRCFAILTLCTILWATEVKGSRYSSLLFCFSHQDGIGNSAFRDLIAGSIASRLVPSHPRQGRCSNDSSSRHKVSHFLALLPTVRLKNGLKICILGYVFTDYHVAHWGFHYLIGFKQDQHRSCFNHTRTKFGRYTTK